MRRPSQRRIQHDYGAPEVRSIARNGRWNLPASGPERAATRIPSTRRPLRLARRWPGAVLLVALLTALLPVTVSAVEGQPPSIYFPETGQTVALDFWQFWLDRGGEEVFGLPISAEYDEDGVGVQWFERARFERWPGRRGIVLPLIGEEALRAAADSGEQVAVSVTGKGRFFPETGYTVHNPFLTYFHRHGGIAIFGYPISARRRERNVIVQYFQRARLELSREGTVRVGTLGLELATAQGMNMQGSPQPQGTVVWRDVVKEPEAADDTADEESLIAAVLTMEQDVPDQSLWEELRWIDVSVGSQRVTAYEGDRVIFTDLVSTGKQGKGLTPLGLFSIKRRIYNETMNSATIGIPLGNPLYYLLKNVLYTQYFDDNGDALHYAWWHNNFGQPMSYGCVNMRLATARFFWEWASVGTPVFVHS